MTLVSALVEIEATLVVALDLVAARGRGRRVPLVINERGEPLEPRTFAPLDCGSGRH